MAEGATLKIYGAVFGGLLALTAVTVGVSYLELGASGNVLLAVLVAACKASLVAAFFMHLKWDRRALLVTIFFPLVLFLIIILSNLPDTVLRHSGEQKPAWKDPSAATESHKH